MVKHTETSPLVGAKSESDSGGHNTFKTNGSISSRGAAERAQGEYEEHEAEEKPTVNMGALIPAVAIGVMLSAADQTIIVSSSGKIGSDLKALNNISWIANAYFLTLTSFQPLYGRLSDIFGRKAALLFAYAVFGTGCFFCGLARNIGELVAARAFSGIGAGGMTTVVAILISDYVPLADRGVWQGCINIIWCIGGSSGAPLGGIFSDTIGWRWLFIIQGPLCAIAFIAVYFVLPPEKASELQWRQKLRRIDLLGAITLVAAIFLLLLGMDRGSNVAWRDQITMMFCGLAIPMFVLFAFVEMKIAAHPFAPGSIIFGRKLFPAYLNNFFVWASYMGNTFYIPLYLQAVHGLTASDVGVLMIIPIILCASTSLACGRIMQRTKRFYWLTIINTAIMVPGALMVLLTSGLVASIPAIVVVGMTFTAMGTGGSVTTTLIATLANADAADQAVATACTYLFRSLGSIVGISTASTATQLVSRRLLKARLGSGNDADNIVQRVRESLDYIKALEPKTREIVVSCYQRATNAAFAIAVVTAVAGLVSAFFINEARIKKKVGD